VSGDAAPGDDSPFFDLRNLLSGAATDPWANAGELAATIASGGGSEPNVDPMVRMQLENLVRVAELHVAQATGITLPSNTTVSAVNRSAWTKRSLESYRQFFERFGQALGDAVDTTQIGANDPLTAMLGQVFQALGPMLVSATAGSMLGHLGQRALGQYDLPIPRATDEVLVVPGTIDEAADDWGVPRDDLRLWILVHELTAHAVLSVPHVGRRLESLLIDFASAFRPNADLIAEEMGGFDGLNDLSKIQELSETFNDPDVVLSMMRSPAHDLLLPQLDALVSAVLGFVGHTVESICGSLVGSNGEIRRRFRQRWIDVSPADRFMERLLGLEITARTFERGDRFVSGIDERAGAAGLERLWADELDLPTAAEIDAPGLWLARIGFDPEMGDIPSSVPDDLSGLDDD
jgi:putative hydrolase